MTQPSFAAYGAVDLAALAAQRAAEERAQARAHQQAEGGSPAPVVVDVTEGSFQAEVVDRSMTVPVVLDFWATWCQPCRTLSPILERAAEADDGAWVLARIDVDANQRLAAAAQVQSIPTVHVVWQGQLVPGFTGALPEPDVRAFLDQVKQLASAGAGEPVQGVDPHLDAAADALDAGDLDAAEAAYQALLAERPGDADARAGLATVGLLRRVAGRAPEVVLAEAGRDQAVGPQLAAADIEFATGNLDAAFDRLVAGVRRSSGEEREAYRGRLVEFFEMLPPDDARVARARTALASALF
ncbi:MAG TPA: tetratricopeptide repeat protein [Actinomycetes bacterium]|nr:tetratricopeptide repeat protein [Actinomycetes bacterium]